MMFRSHLLVARVIFCRRGRLADESALSHLHRFPLFNRVTTMKPLLVFLALASVVLADRGPIAGTSVEARRTAKESLRTTAERWADVAKAEAPSFRRHVIPLFSRAGCSGRECHGAFNGQGGFQLSLFGYDFEKDHHEITSDPEGARIALKEPVKSLLLTKPSLDDGETHKGKKRFDKGSWEYHLVLRWIQEGAKMDVAETGEFDRLEVNPDEIIFQKPGETQQLRVLAHWKDGTIEDVTQLTRFRTNDESVADVSATGLVTCKEKGDTHVVAFYDNGVQPVPTMLPASEFTGAKYPQMPERTKVDELVLHKLRKAGIVASDVCSDAEFLRRVSLDLTATLPTPGEVQSFLHDEAPDKRAKKIEELLKTPGYAAWWTTLLCDFAGNDPRRLSAPTGDENFFSAILSRQWFDWVRRRVEGNEPYDRIAAGLILATGRTRPDQSYTEYAQEMASYFSSANPADFSARPNMPYFWQRNNLRKPEEKALAFAHTFLGVRIECAQCHKHPFDQWTKTDFEQFQAFFEPLRYEGKTGTGEEVDFQAAQKTFKASLDPEKSGGQKYRAEEFKKQIDAGTILPWPEIYVSGKRMSEKEIAQRKKKDPDFSGRVLTPKILGGGEVLVTQYRDPREPLMNWLRTRENPYFARAFVNRVWAVYFGRGIVEPADDMNLANPPSNKELMDYLAEGFVKSGYDMKWLHREIVKSDTYQRSWKPTPSNQQDEKNFSRAVIRRLPAEVAFDSIAMATAASSEQAKFAADLENRAIGPNATISGKIKGGDRYALTTFGKPSRNMNCDCERTADPTLLQTIYTRNDPALLALVDGKRQAGGWIGELRERAEHPPERVKADLVKLEAEKQAVAQNRTEREKEQPLDEEVVRKFETRMKELDERIERARALLAKAEEAKPFDLEQLIEEVFLRTVSRPPTKTEISHAKQDIHAAGNLIDGLRELLWALLNTREFMVNH
jgi:hypothetical protein